ncbi:MAG: leucine-rich repeat protein [Oscillospiraceae bacterium]|nr:leucine-rich repeat protein [Oscillospiraceae bacterium]
MKKARKGFTLIEVICVLTIIAIIAAIAVPGISGYIDKSKKNNCRTVMQNFVNDLEYRIVSRRYYDADDLDKGLADYVKSYSADIGTSEIEHGKEFTVEGLCPNHGKYYLKWVFDNKTDNSIEVTVGVYNEKAGTNVCWCDCFSDTKSGEKETNEDTVMVSTHMFTASLISSNYDDSSVIPSTPGSIIEDIIAAIEGKGPAPDDIKSIIDDKYPQYKLSGFTYNETTKKVEWISIYIETEFDSVNNKYSYEFYSKTMDDPEDYEPEAQKLSGDVQAINDYKKWPPAQGNAGSKVYKQSWNTVEVVANTESVISVGENGTVNWIQRDGNWYVEQVDEVKGINLPESASDTARNTIKSKHELTGIEMSFDKDIENDYGNIIVYPKYDGSNSRETGKFFGKISSTMDDDSTEYNEKFYIRNGFVVTDNLESLKDPLKNGNSFKDWTGIYSDSENASGLSTVNTFNNYKEVFKITKDTIDKIKAGNLNKFYIVYQEPYKSVDSDNVWNTDIRTEVIEINKQVSDDVILDENGNVDKDKIDIVIKDDGNGNIIIESGGQTVLKPDSGDDVKLDETVKIPILDPGSIDRIDELPNGGLVIGGETSDDKKNNIDLIIEGVGESDIVFQKPIQDENGNTTTQETPVGKISSEFDSAVITYKDKDIENKFDVNDISIESKFIIQVTANKKTTVVEHKREVKHMTSASDKSGFYLKKTDDNSAGYADDSEVINAINTGTCSANIFYHAPGFETDIIIGQISTRNSSVSLSYNKNDEDTSFDIDKVKVTAEYKLNISGGDKTTVSGAENAKVYFEVSRIKDNALNGFYVSDSAGGSDREDDVISKLNSGTASASIYYHESGKSDDEKIGEVSNSFILNASYSKIGDTFNVSDLTVDANYTMTVFRTVSAGNEKLADITYKKDLKHVSSQSTDNYYLSTDENEQKNISNLSETDKNTVHKLQTEKYAGPLYITHIDNNVVPGYTSVLVDTEAAISLIPYVCYKLDSSANVYLDEYIGTETDLVVPSTIQGFWSTNKNDIGNNLYIEKQLSDGTTAYYINDKKTYTVKRIGQEAVRPENSADKYSLKFPSGYKLNSVTVSNTVEKIGYAAFLNSELTKITFESGSSLKYVDDHAFEKCEYLENLILPDSLLTIGNQAFKSLEKAGTISLGNSIISIGEEAFLNCKVNSTTEFTIPESVTKIGKNAFNNFVMTNGTMTINGCTDLIPENVNSISSSESVATTVNAFTVEGANYTALISSDVFSGMEVNSLVIGGIVEKIGESAFKGVKFNSINEQASLKIEGNVNTIGGYAFKGCDFKSELKFGDNVTTIEHGAFEGCGEFNGTLDLNKVQTIGNFAFSGMVKATGGLTVPLTVNSIGEQAFDSFAGSYNFDNNNNNDNKIGELVIEGGSSNQGQTLGGLIFTNAKFNNVKIIGTKIKEISAYAFKNSPVNGSTPYNDIKGNLVISDSVTTIGKSAFEGCAGFTGELDLPEGLTVINDATFNGCLGFTGDLNIPSTVTQIGSRAFMGCVGLNGSLTLSNSLEKIGMEAFKDCINFEGGLTIPSSVTKGIGNCAFQQFAKNTSKQGLLEINAGSYSDGTKLGSFIFTEAKFNGITVGGIVQEISANAFHNAQSDELDLNYYDPDDPDNKSTTSTGGETNTPSGEETNTPTGGETNTPSGEETTTEGSLSKKTLIADYSGITGSLDLKSGLEIVGENAFYGCTGLDGTISMPKVTSIGAHAFENCSNLTGIAELKSVQTIGDSAFENCSNLTGIAELKSVQTIGDSAFKNCSKMSGDLNFPSTLTSIGSSAFYNGSSIGLVSIPDSVTSIGSSAFENSGSGSSLTIYGCSGKETVDGNEVGVLGDGTNSIFRNSNYSNITIGGSVITIIKEKAFQECTRLRGTLTISGNVEEIRKFAFDTCENLTSLSIDNGYIQKIYEGAFARCRRVEGGLYIPPTVNYMERCAFKQFAESTPPEKLGKLKVYGTSDANGNLGNPNLNSDGAPLFSSARFNGVTIGGKVKVINHSQFNNRLFYNFGDNMKDENDNVIVSPLGGSPNYDFSGISGDLIIEDGVEKIGPSAFFSVQFDNVTIPKSVYEIHPKSFFFTGTGNGSLTVFGSSNANNTLGDGSNPIFLGSKFNGVTIGGRVEHIGAHLFHNMDTYDYYECEEERDGQKINVKYNYTYSNITGNLTIKNTVLTIGVSAFESCAFNGRLLLGEAILQDNPEWDTDPEHRSVHLTTVGEYAFKNCNYFTGDLVIPHTITSMGEGSFHGFASNSSKPGALILWAGSSDNGNTINREIFVGSQFHNVKIGGNVNKISDNAFININKDPGRLYNKVTGTLSLGPGVTEIGTNAFRNCVFDGELLISDQSDRADADKKPVSELPEVSIGANAFSGCSKFYTNYTSADGSQAVFTIPETVTAIGEHAFSGMCSSTRDSKIPALKILGTSNPDDKGAFGSKAPLENNKYPTIQIFDNAQFKNVTIGGKVKVLAEEAFNNNNGAYSKLKGNLTIESTVDYVWKRAFYNCSGFEGELTLGFDYNQEKAKIIDGIQQIGPEAFAGCSNFSGGLRIPASVYSIDEKAFESFAANTSSPGKLIIEGYSSTVNRELETDSHSNTVTLNQIDAKIFNNSKFHDVSVGWNVQSIADNFMMTNKSYNYDYTKISGSLYIGQNVVYIGTSAFSMRNAGGEGGFDGTLTFNMNNSYYKTISNDAFYGQKFTGDLILPHSLYVIKDSAFEECRGFNGKLEFEYADGGGTMRSVAKIGNYAFKNCVNFYTNPAVERILTIPETVLAIGNETNDSDAFDSFASNSDGPELKLYAGSHDNGTTLKKGIFKNAKFHNVTIGGKITTIDSEAFKSDYGVYNGLTGNLTIEENTVQTIKNGAFQKASGFDGILYLGSVKTIEANAFNNCINFSGGLVIPYGMNGIGDSAFYKFASNTQNPGPFDIWSGTEVSNGHQILDGAPFLGAKFKDMIVHGSVNSIKANAFNSWEKAAGEDFRNFTGSLRFTSKTEIGSYAFCCDTGFDGELLFGVDQEGKGVSRIGEGAFAGCTNFYKNYTKSDNSQAVFTIPETVTEIKANAFESMCSGITDMDRIPKLEILGVSLTTTDSNGNITDKAFGSTGPWNANTQKYDTISIFKNAKFNNVYIGGQVQSIAERAFDNSYGDYNGITGDIEINVKNIWEKAFYNMESVDENYRGKLILDEGVEKIGAYAFAKTRFFGNVAIEERSFVIPGSVKSIDSCAFQYFCREFGNPPSLTVRGYASTDVEGKGNGYGESASNIFEYSSFRNVTFEGNVKVIGKNAFNNSDGRYNGWTGVYTFNAGGLVRLYDGCFNGHNFSNVKLAKSIKRNGGLDLVSWASWDKSGVFGTDKNVSTF